jgi:hypothetical protein
MSRIMIVILIYHRHKLTDLLKFIDVSEEGTTSTFKIEDQTRHKTNR